MNSETYANDYETILNEIKKASMFEEFKPLKMIKKETLTKKNIQKIKKKLNKYFKKHDDFFNTRRTLNREIKCFEEKIKDNFNDMNYKRISFDKYSKINSELVNNMMISYDKYEINEQNHKYVMKIIKYLLVCVKFNIKIDEIILNCMVSMRLFGQYFGSYYELFMINKKVSDYTCDSDSDDDYYRDDIQIHNRHVAYMRTLTIDN